MRPRLLAALAVIVASLAPAAPASAFLIQERGGPQSATNGIVLGPDGNFWAAEEISDSVLRMTPGGTVLAHYALGAGAAPTGVATGPGGRVWVAATGLDKLVWFDALSPAPMPNNVPTTGATDCGPVAIVAGGEGRMYFSLPAAAGCTNGDRLGHVADDGTGGATTAVIGGRVFDLAVTGGKLFAPDFNGGVVRRLGTGGSALLFESSISIPTPGAQPDGITADGAGNLWVTDWGTGRIDRFPASQNGADATVFTPVGGTLSNPFGIVAGADGRMYIAGKASKNLVRLSADGGSWAFYPTSDSEPFNVINGTDGDIWATTQNKTHLLRLVNSAPRLTAGAASATAPTSAAARATVNPRGNETQVVFDYGPTIAYGSSTPPIVVANSADPSEVTGVMAGLVPGTTYHVRARASNPEGSVQATDVTFATPPGVVDNDKDGVSPPVDCNDANPAIRPGATDVPGNKVDEDCSGRDAAFPELTATTNFFFDTTPTTMTIRRIEISRLKGGETATIRCTGRRCPFTVKRYTKLKKGKRAFGRALLRGRKLPVGAVMSVRVTKAQTIGTFTSITARRKQRPRILRRCLQPGRSAPSACP